MSMDIVNLRRTQATLPGQGMTVCNPTAVPFKLDPFKGYIQGWQQATEATRVRPDAQQPRTALVSFRAYGGRTTNSRRRVRLSLAPAIGTRSLHWLRG